jgi:glycosyltransferase involved in cell wall biosynthesis
VTHDLSAAVTNHEGPIVDQLQPISPSVTDGCEQELKPLLVVGFTHSQTAIVLEGRLRAFVRAGFRVIVISSRGELLDRLQCQEGVETIALQMERSMAPFRDMISLARLFLLLRRLRPDVTEFGTPKAGLLGNIAAALCGVPRRVYLLRGLRLETASGLKRILLLASECVAAACSHVVLCNSKSLLDQARMLGIAKASKLCILGQGSGKGVDVVRFRPAAAKESEQHSGRPVIGYVGRLTRDKGIPQLVEAFNSLLETLPSARLHLVGWFDESDDALTPELRRGIDVHPAILRTGFVTDTAEYYRSFDMLVLPTLREGFPNVALEAAASGVPVIATSATGARDAVQHGETGLLVPPGDKDALVKAMLDLAGNPEKARRMGIAAREWVLKSFVDRHVQALAVSFYRELCYEARKSAVQFAVTDAAVLGD